MSKLDRENAVALRDDLLELFDAYGVNVAVGVTQKGVAIRSQDEAVDATNLGAVTPLPAPATPPVPLPPPQPPVLPQPRPFPQPTPWPGRPLPGEPFILD